MALPINVTSRKDKKCISELNLGKIIKPTMSFNIMNDKDRYKLIKKVEYIVRSSIEYKQYIKFLKDELDMTRCSFFSNITNKDNRGKRISIEIHHEPFTLYEIVLIMVNRFISDDISLNPLSIANEVMKLHYRDMVGLIPLSSTVHDLVHDGDLFIPAQNVYGDYLSFVDEFAAYIPEEIESSLSAKLELSKQLIEPDMSILEKSFVYVNVDGFTLPQFVK